MKQIELFPEEKKLQVIFAKRNYDRILMMEKIFPSFAIL